VAEGIGCGACGLGEAILIGKESVTVLCEGGITVDKEVGWWIGRTGRRRV